MSVIIKWTENEVDSQEIIKQLHFLLKTSD